MQWQYVGMREIGSDLDLLVEPLGAQRGGKLWPEDLERHLPLVLEILSEIYGRHPTSTKLSLDPVAVRQRSFQAFQLVCHEQAPSGPALRYGLDLETARLVAARTAVSAP